MNMMPVSSSNLAAVGYDGRNLYVEFHSGWLYEYANVPRNVYESLLSADSKGKFLHYYIKGNYSYRRLA